jgi:predicted CXXCH cytochrome family protein
LPFPWLSGVGCGWHGGHGLKFRPRFPMDQPNLSALVRRPHPLGRWGRRAAGLLLLLFAFVQCNAPELRVSSGPAHRADRFPPPDPRLAFPTPYRNVRPEVRYVGDTACAACHLDKMTTFHAHPMGRSSPAITSLAGLELGGLAAPLDPLPGSTALAARLGALERYGTAVHNPFKAQGHTYRVERRGPNVFHIEEQRDAEGRVILAVEAPVVMAVGSGSRGRSYVVNREGSLVQSPISWFSQRGIWDLSPGYERHNQHFERPIGRHCLYCHTNRAEPVPDTVNRYRVPLALAPGIGCERCHGPGELHVASRRRGEALGGADYTIVNPARLAPPLRDAVCEQCHVSGEQTVMRPGRQLEDYRPGLPLDQFWSLFVLPADQADQHKSVTNVEQMHRSRCFQMSQGKLGCISCHDPHEEPAPGEAAAFYRGRCLRCHAGTPTPADHGGHARKGRVKGCSQAMAVRQQQGDSCTACHMPRLRSSNIAHAANTDHRVLRRPEPEGTAPLPGQLRLGQPPLVHIHQDRFAPDDPGLARDLGIALANTGRAELALPRLDAALEAWPDDLDARDARARALAGLGRSRQALDDCEAVLSRAPRREETLTRAALLAAKVQRPDDALRYWQRALAVNPQAARYHFAVGRIYQARGAWAEAADAYRQGLLLSPFDEEARQALVECYLHLGDRDRADDEFQRVLGLNPPEHREALRAWFASKRR